MKILSADHVLPVSQDPICDGAVVVAKDKIVALGEKRKLREDYPDAELKDFGDAVIMPGLVNCHSHLELTILRGFLDRFDDDFASWLLALTKIRTEKLSDDDIKISAELGALEGVKAGVTCFADIGRFGRAGFGALRKSGLRGVLYQETEFSPDNKSADEDFERLSEKVQTLQQGETKLVRAGISPHSPYTVSCELFEKLAEHSIELNIPITIHAAESREEQTLMQDGKGFFTEIYGKQKINWQSPNSSTINYLNEIGVLKAKPLLAHCVTVSDQDIEMICENDARIAHCPKSNAKFGHGIAPFDAFLKKGVKVGFGSDSTASNNICDIFEEARFASLLSRTRNDNKRFVHPKEIIETATLGGAKALGMEKEIGTLDIGKQADIIVVTTKSAAQKPVYDVYSSLVFTTCSRDVIFTMVAGTELYENGKLTHADAAEIHAKVLEVSSKLRG